MSGLVKLFGCPWAKAPAVFLGAETTGKKAGVDGVCQLGAVRFENGEPVSRELWLVNPGQPIPPDATESHGVNDEMVKGAPSLVDVFEDPRLRRLIDGAQPAAFDAPFARAFMPPRAFDREWPWLDSLMMVRIHDKTTKRGRGRSTLHEAALRHGIELPEPHTASQDAEVAGKLLYMLVGYGELTPMRNATMGGLLAFQERERWADWHRFTKWISEKGPR